MSSPTDIPIEDQSVEARMEAAFGLEQPDATTPEEAAGALPTAGIRKRRTIQ